MKNGQVFGSTINVDKHIKSLYPEAKFVPVCALGLYYTIYSDSTYSKQIAEYRYLEQTDSIPVEARNERRDFGSYFKLLWIN